MEPKLDLIRSCGFPSGETTKMIVFNSDIFHGIETGNKETESKGELLARDFLGSRRVQKIGFPP